MTDDGRDTPIKLAWSTSQQKATRNKKAEGSMMMRKSLVLLCFPLLSAMVVGDVNDPQFLARIQYFDVVDPSTYTCTDSGARCQFTREDFDSEHFGQGQETQVFKDVVWAATVENAVLSLGNCVGSTCQVSCNANCTCTSNEVPCEKGEAPPPTPAPVAAPLVGPMCSTQRFTEHCPMLMQTALPKGQEKWFDCFNFCGGALNTACLAGEECGTTTCDDATAAGTMTGEVFGCTVDHLDVQISSDSAVSPQLCALSLLIAIAAFELMG